MPYILEYVSGPLSALLQQFPFYPCPSTTLTTWAFLQPAHLPFLTDPLPSTRSLLVSRSFLAASPLLQFHRISASLTKFQVSFVFRAISTFLNWSSSDLEVCPLILTTGLLLVTLLLKVDLLRKTQVAVIAKRHHQVLGHRNVRFSWAMLPIRKTWQLLTTHLPQELPSASALFVPFTKKALYFTHKQKGIKPAAIAIVFPGIWPLPAQKSAPSLREIALNSPSKNCCALHLSCFQAQAPACTLTDR